MNKKIKISITSLVILAGIYSGYNHARTTPEGTIKLYLVSHGHIIDALKADVQISTEDAPWKGKYFCKNISSGPDFYELYQKDGSNYWYINYTNTGGA